MTFDEKNGHSARRSQITGGEVAPLKKNVLIQVFTQSIVLGGAAHLLPRQDGAKEVVRRFSTVNATDRTVKGVNNPGRSSVACVPRTAASAATSHVICHLCAHPGHILRPPELSHRTVQNGSRVEDNASGGDASVARCVESNVEPRREHGVTPLRILPHSLLLTIKHLLILRVSSRIGLDKQGKWG